MKNLRRLAFITDKEYGGMLERYLVEHCSPTLASIKTANLFTYAYSSEEEVQEQIALWNASMNDKGIFVMELRRSEKAALIYVCRKSFLERDLKKPGVAQIPGLIRSCFN